MSSQNGQENLNNGNVLNQTAGSHLTGGSANGDQLGQMIDPNQAQQFMQQLTPAGDMDAAISMSQGSGERPITPSQMLANQIENQESEGVESQYRQTLGSGYQLAHKNMGLKQDGMSEQEQISQISQSRQEEMQGIGRDMKSPNFFQMSGIPKFGKNWLDNFIPDEEMQNTFMTSEVVRNVVMLQCVYYASVYNELVLYKHTFINGRGSMDEIPNQVSVADLPAGENAPVFKVGIIGCGQTGTVLLTKLLEVKDQFHNLQMIVSTRQPHLLRPFQQEFGVECVFDNQKVAAESDIVFVCVLPSQVQEVFKEIRGVIRDRIDASKKDKTLINPLIVSTCAAISYKKLRLMLSDQAVFLRTSINVPVLKEYLFRSQAIAQTNVQEDEVMSKGSKASATNPDAKDSQKSGSGAQNQRTKINLSVDGKSKPGTGMSGASKQGGQKPANGKPSKFDRILSSKAVQIGHEQGITAEFICKQTAEQTCFRLNELFELFDIFQNSLYANDPEVARGESRAGSQTEQQVKQSEAGESQRFTYEESILVTILGENYLEFINEETGEWEQDERVIQTFQELFEFRIRMLFEAESLEK